MGNKLHWKDPEMWTFEEQKIKLKELYLELNPWHDTPQAKYYDYPTFDQAVSNWASDDFYAQHSASKLYCEVTGIHYDN